MGKTVTVWFTGGNKVSSSVTGEPSVPAENLLMSAARTSWERRLLQGIIFDHVIYLKNKLAQEILTFFT